MDEAGVLRALKQWRDRSHHRHFTTRRTADISVISHIASFDGPMSSDAFVLALRALDAPVFLDDRGTATSLGTEFTATTADGKSVLVTQLSPALIGRVTKPDAFVRAVEQAGYEGAGITESGELYFLEIPPRGASLATRLAATGPIPAPELITIARGAADRLTDGSVHGLITPSTVHVAVDGGVSLRWRGLATALHAAGVDAATIAAELDAAEYLAPELQRGSAFDVRTDIFALGATLYAALTGRPPFGGRTTATVMAVVLADDGAPVTTVSGTLTTALVRAIEQDPADRWHDMEQFRDALGKSEHNQTGDRHPPRASSAPRRGCALAALTVAGAGLLSWIAAHYIS
jgi:hypothetical protein